MRTQASFERDEIYGHISANNKRRKPQIFAFIACVLIAFSLWLIVKNLSDTDITVSYKLSIELVGELPENYSVYYISNNDATVNLSGSNRDIKNYKASDFHLVLNISDLKETDEYPLSLSCIVPPQSSIKVVSIEPANVIVKIDKKVEKKDVAVSSEIGNKIIDSRFTTSTEVDVRTTVNGLETVTPIDKIDITGPETLVEKIESIVLVINPGIVDGSISYSSFELKCYKANGELIEESTDSLKVSTQGVEVLLKVSVEKEVPIVATYEGVPLTNAKVSVPTVTIKGEPKYVTTIKEIAVDLSLLDGVDGEYTYDLNSYPLPERVSFASDVGEITVTYTNPATGEQPTPSGESVTDGDGHE